jgi:hypothetical protein
MKSRAWFAERFRTGASVLVSLMKHPRLLRRPVRQSQLAAGAAVCRCNLRWWRNRQTHRIRNQHATGTCRVETCPPDDNETKEPT